MTFSYSYASLKSVTRSLRLATIVVGLAASQGMAQHITVSLNSGNVVAGGSANLNIALVSTGGTSSSAVQWTMSYPAAVASVGVVAGSAAAAAGKNVTCSSTTGATTCVAIGVNGDSISDGVLAVATFNISPSAATSSIPIQVANVIAATAATETLLSSGTGATISVNQSPNIPGTPSPTSITLDSQVRRDQSTASSTVTSPMFSTAASHELFLAFIAADLRSGIPTSVTSVSGAGLTWVRVAGTPTRRGTAEIWRAFSGTPLSSVTVGAALSQSVTSSMTVMTFAGVDTTGPNGSGAIGSVGNGGGRTGKPTASLTTTRNNSWVVGVGDDLQTAASRMPLPGQTLVHQYLDPAGNTYWVQMSSGSIPLSGSRVTIGDSAPTGDPYNLAIAEILAASPASQTTSAVVGASVMSAMATAGAAPSQSPNAPILSNLAGNPATNACSPGGLALLTGAGLTSQAPQSATSFPLPPQLSDLQVNVNGTSAPLLFASDSQVRFQCPMLPSGAPLEIALQGPAALSTPLPLSLMQATAPEIFTLGATDQGVIAFGPPNELATSNTQIAVVPAAQAGEILTIYASGLGTFNGNIALGTPVPPGAPILLKNPIHVMVAGIEIDSAFAGLAEGEVGLSKVNVVLPQSIPSGPAIPLYIQVLLPDGTVVESNEVTVAIN